MALIQVTTEAVTIDGDTYDVRAAYGYADSSRADALVKTWIQASGADNILNRLEAVLDLLQFAIIGWSHDAPLTRDVMETMPDTHVAAVLNKFATIYSTMRGVAEDSPLGKRSTASATDSAAKAESLKNDASTGTS